MDFASVTQAITTIGFPIVACCGLFYLYDKTIKELTATITKIDVTLTHIMERLEGPASNGS